MYLLRTMQEYYFRETYENSKFANFPHSYYSYTGKFIPTILSIFFISAAGSVTTIDHLSVPIETPHSKLNVSVIFLSRYPLGAFFHPGTHLEHFSQSLFFHHNSHALNFAGIFQIPWETLLGF